MTAPAPIPPFNTYTINISFSTTFLGFSPEEAIDKAEIFVKDIGLDPEDARLTLIPLASKDPS